MKMPPWTHTLLDTFETCPKQAYEKFIAKSVPFQETPEMTHGKRVHAALQKRLNEGTPLPDDMPYEHLVAPILGRPQLQAEMKLGMAYSGKWLGFFEPDVWGRGVLDVVTVSQDRTTAFLLDWKTGKKRENPSELETHAVLLKAAVPQLKQAWGAYVWLKEGKMGEVHALDFDRKLHTIRRAADEIKAMLEANREFPARENPLCGRCGVTACRFNPNRKPF